MSTVHADNAKEFRGTMLRKAYQEYGIHLHWRPVRRPHFGGHIERLLGTLNHEIHNLPGSTACWRLYDEGRCSRLPPYATADGYIILFTAILYCHPPYRVHLRLRLPPDR